MLDLLLTNARIVDGTGNPWRKGCVGVRDGRIVAVGSAHDMPEARTVLDIRRQHPVPRLHRQPQPFGFEDNR